MKFLKSLSLLLLTSLFLISCGNSDDDFASQQAIDPCLDLGALDLKITIQDEFVSLPAKVSVFFKVNDKDGNPVAGLTPSDFKIYEKGRNDNCFNTISSSESNARISPNEQIFKQHTILVLDLSGSVLNQSLFELKAATSSFIRNVMPDTPVASNQMAIYWFDGEDKLHQLQELTGDQSVLLAAVNSIDENISQDSSTDLYGAVLKSTAVAEDLLNETAQQEIISAASVVIFTDGTDQAGRYNRDAALKSVNEASDNISFFSIGLGSEIDEAVLANIGKTSSVFAENKEELEATFNEISDAVGGQARSFYLFEYCSPKRDGSGVNQLVIQAFDGSRTGAVQTSFSAEGFTSGCE
ncbi:VWA domain-containing protein [Robertkochia marina]|uniref:VWA domain-containing protein n=1 Tax=Robertkochia marina TaxID=1227945 RepID=A0A4S3M147_9FLAO|nr:VWA domain-containing protein [Robertkochia marina]THD67908.1 VWA domain-containing protein [Robertkochia marina]TRZ41015.1 VWA domain-containing protein [Robertkochia marina]